MKVDNLGLEYKRETGYDVGVYEDNNNWYYHQHYVEWLEQKIKALRQHDVVGRIEQLKCQCKKAKFTRTVDADFNPLCGRCGKAL